MVCIHVEKHFNGFFKREHLELGIEILIARSVPHLSSETFDLLESEVMNQVIVYVHVVIWWKDEV